MVFPLEEALPPDADAHRAVGDGLRVSQDLECLVEVRDCLVELAQMVQRLVSTNRAHECRRYVTIQQPASTEGTCADNKSQHSNQSVQRARVLTSRHNTATSQHRGHEC